MTPKEQPSEIEKDRQKRRRGISLLLAGKEPEELAPDERQHLAFFEFLYGRSAADFFEALANYIRSQDSSLKEEVRKRNADEWQRRFEIAIASVDPGFTPPKGRKKENYERDTRICDMKDNKGKNFKQIGEIVGLTPQAVRRAHKRFHEHKARVLKALTTAHARLQEAASKWSPETSRPPSETN